MTSLLLASLLLLAAPEPAGEVVNRVAAVVNGDVLTLLDLEEKAGAELRRADAEPAGPARDRARARVLRAAFDALLADKLIDAQVKELALEVSDAEVSAVIEDTKKRYGLDDETLDRALLNEGLTRPLYRAKVKRDLESFRVLSLKVRSRINVSDEDLRNHYQQHLSDYASGQEIRVRHIFLSLAPGAPAADEAKVREKAQRALQRVRGGEDFAKVAREVSQGPSAADGGDLGWLRRGVVQPEVERAAFALETGHLSDLVRTRTGFQILKVEERRGGQPRPFDEVKDEIRDRLTNDQADAARAQYVAELKKDAFIEVRLPELKDPKP
ncbi:MAG: peptidylprolyl isomerase [Deltaproteobacteria bacterium]|nr:peptidylprolyl isomerase [Deltaproteobacteria bacterium]